MLIERLNQRLGTKRREMSDNTRFPCLKSTSTTRGSFVKTNVAKEVEGGSLRYT